MITEVERMDLTIDDKKELDFIFINDYITPEEVRDSIEKYGPGIKILVKELDNEPVEYIGIPGIVKTNCRNGGICYYRTQLWHLVNNPNKYKPSPVDLRVLFSNEDSPDSEP